MSEPSAFGFGQFVPGFDFLQNLSKNASQAQPAASGIPGMGSWVAPTLSIEDIDKRIQELKSVLFWLEQNTTALKATIQAMEVQKMTLSTLQSMNVSMTDLAKAFTAKMPEVPSAPAADPAPASAASPSPEPRPSLFTPKPTPAAEPAAQAAPPSTPVAEPTPDPADAPPASEAAPSAVDPMQWWGALTQQFQGIAAAALKDVAGEALKAGVADKKRKTPSAVKAPKAAVPGQAPAPSRAAKPASAKVKATGAGARATATKAASGVAARGQAVSVASRTKAKAAKSAKSTQK